MWEKEKSLVTSNFSFSHSVFKRLVQQTRKNQGLFGKGLNVYQKLKFALGRVENIMGHGENAGFQHFLLFPKGFFLSEVKSGLGAKELMKKCRFLLVCTYEACSSGEVSISDRVYYLYTTDLTLTFFKQFVFSPSNHTQPSFSNPLNINFCYISVLTLLYIARPIDNNLCKRKLFTTY